MKTWHRAGFLEKKCMKFGRTGAVVLTVAAVALLAALLLPLVSTATNCGGNNAAISVCKQCALEVLLSRINTRTNGFEFARLPETEKVELAKLAHSHWVPSANFWIQTNVANLAGSKQILVVCDRAYGNLPAPTWRNGYRKNLAHAVAYSDGSGGIITPAEFAKLDFALFIKLSSLTEPSSSTNGH